MAKQLTQAPAKSGGALSRLGYSARSWLSEFISPAREINEATGFMYGASPTTVASLLGTGRRAARDRQSIYDKWSQMEGDAICSTAILLLTTSALGGHETSGDTVFVETRPEAKKNKQMAAIVEEIAADLGPRLNKIAFQCAYTGGVFGDAYARLYSEPKKGIVDIYTDELVRPQLVQPYEQGSRTIGFAVYTGERNFNRLDVSQLARLKMPRTQWVPQYGVVEKALRLAITEDSLEKLPVMPSMVGGSLLHNAEEAYDNLAASLVGLVGQRWMDSISEEMLQVNLSSMTLDQQERFLGSVTKMLQRSKKYAEDAVSSGRPRLEKIRHLLPVFGEKQISSLTPTSNGGRASSITIDDVMMHARLLSGALGVDLSMLGFADQLAGGLGEGGFFRVSAQAAERARVIRNSVREFFNHIIDVHCLHRYGMVFSEAERPWNINFYGSISALEAEKQRTRADAMNGGVLLAQALQTLKDMGCDEKMLEMFLTKQMMLDEDEAKLYAKALVSARDKDSEDGGGPPGEGDFSGGGGGFGGGMPKVRPPIPAGQDGEDPPAEE